MTSSENSTTLGDLVLAQPAAAALFERLGLDYCCGGTQTLEQACSTLGLDAKTVSVTIDALADLPANAGADGHDVAQLSVPELCDHIVASHHEPLRNDLVRISDLLETVVRVHGGSDPKLFELKRRFTATRRELETHLSLEEEIAFPSCRAVDAGSDAHDFDEGGLAHLEHSHDAVGDALRDLRDLAGGYDLEQAYCNTHRALLAALNAVELDMHQHIHEENNVLFPRVRGRLAAHV